MKINVLSESPKQWWKLSSSLLLKSRATNDIPPLQSADGVWARSPKEKADLLAEVFANKFNLPTIEINEYSTIGPQSNHEHSGFLPMRVRLVRNILAKLRTDCATGPDLLSTRLLKRYGKVLAVPIAIICRAILRTGCWPASWKIHWILPLYKKKSKMNPSNYRGVHLTCQLSKVIERVFAFFCSSFFEASSAYGPNQFAYHRHRGYRDALAFNICCWFKAFHENKKVALYCSDVSGAFDRVCSTRLIEKI